MPWRISGIQMSYFLYVFSNFNHFWAIGFYWDQRISDCLMPYSCKFSKVNFRSYPSYSLLIRIIFLGASSRKTIPLSIAPLPRALLWSCPMLQCFCTRQRPLLKTISYSPLITGCWGGGVEVINLETHSRPIPPRASLRTYNKQAVFST